MARPRDHLIPAIFDFLIALVWAGMAALEYQPGWLAFMYAVTAYFTLRCSLNWRRFWLVLEKRKRRMTHEKEQS